MAGFGGVSVRLKNVRINEETILAPGSPVYIAAQRAGRAAVKHTKDQLIRHDSIDSGALYNSIDYEIFRSGRGLSIAVGPFKGDDKTKKYARYVEYGTKGPITSKSGKVMPVKIKGGPLLFLTKVNGQEAKPYLAPALRSMNSSDFYK